MPRPSPPLVVLLLGAVLLLLAGTPANAARSYRCGDETLNHVRCSRVIVPVDRTGVVPGEISLSVRTVQLGRRARPHQREAVLFLAGGPGEAATPIVESIAPFLKPLLRHRDLVAVDTRGTGRSSDLIVCPEVETSAALGLADSQVLASCARRLGPAAAHYATTDVVDDLEAVRIAGGYDRLLLVGVSYGTYTAQRYAAAHPDHVAGLVLDSAVDVTGSDPYGLASDRATGGALDQTCRLGACRGVTDDAAGDFARAKRRLPLAARVDGGNGRRVQTVVGPAVLQTLVLQGDLDPVLFAALPSVIRRAAQGDAAPLARLARETGLIPLPGDDDDPAQTIAGAGYLTSGGYFATTCRDTRFPWTDATPLGAARREAAIAAVAARPARDRAGLSPDDVVDSGPAAACAQWPTAPDDAPIGPPAAVPTLVLGGTRDIRTPPAEARRVARRQPGSQLLRVPGQGHSVISAGRSCVESALTAFDHGRPVGRCHTPRGLPRAAPLPPRSAAALGRTGATRARAVASATILDAIRTVLLRASAGNDALDLTFGPTAPIRVAGLRSGYAVAEAPKGIRLVRMGFVPGTAVTGVLAGGDDVRVHVRGTGVRAGTYRVANPFASPARLAAALGLQDADDLDDYTATRVQALESLVGR